MFYKKIYIIFGVISVLKSVQTIAQTLEMSK